VVDVAPGAKPNTLRPVRVGFCLLDVAPPKPPPKHVEKKSEAEAKEEPRPDWHWGRDEYLAGLKVTPLAGAFVAIVRPGGDPTTAIYAKTTDRGVPLRIEKGALDATPPDDNAHWIFLEDGLTYECFWAYEKAHFETAIRDIDSQMSTVHRDYGSFQFTMKQARFDQHVLEDFFPSWSGGGHMEKRNANRLKLAALLHNVGQKGEGYFRHHVIADMNQSGDGAMAVSAALFHGPLAIDWWVFARRPAICITFLAEFVTNYVGRVRLNGLWHFDQLHSVLAVVQAGKEGTRLEEFDAALFGSPKTEHHAAYPGLPKKNAEAYWQYAYACGRATKGGKYVDGSTFAHTLYDFMTYGRPPDSYWYKAAQEIQNDFGIAHPSRGDARDNDDFKPVPPDDRRRYVVGYFDFYQYAVKNEDPGTVNWHNGWMKAAPLAQQKVQEAVERVSGDLRVYFRSHADCMRTWADIGWHVKGDDARRSMNMRFLEAAEDVGYDWWEGFPVPPAKPGKHKKHEPPHAEKKEEEPEEDAEEGDEGEEEEPEGVEPPDPVKQLGPVIMAGWVTGAKQAELFEHFFAWRSRTVATRISADMNTAVAKFRAVNRRIKCIETHLVKGNGLKSIKAGDITVKAEGIGLKKVKGNVPTKARYEVTKPKGRLVVRKGNEVIGEFDIELRDFEGKKIHLGNKQIDVLEGAEHAHGAHGGHGGAAEEGLETLEVNWGKYPKGFRPYAGPNKDVMKAPFWFSGFAYAIIIAGQIHELWQQIKKHEVEGKLVAELGVNLGLEIWTLGEAMELTFLKVAEHKGWHKTVNFIEGWGKFGKLAMGGAVAVEAILIGREGAIILLEEVPVTGAMGKSRRATLLTVKGCVLITGSAGAIAAMAFATVATGGLVLAAAAIGAALIDVAMWIWGERETAMDETHERLVKALGSEMGKDYADTRGARKYAVCRTYDEIAEVAQDLENLAKSLGDMDRLADERRRMQKAKKEQAAAEKGAATAH
jgi:hypothetical protein